MREESLGQQEVHFRAWSFAASEWETERELGTRDPGLRAQRAGTGQEGWDGQRRGPRAQTWHQGSWRAWLRAARSSEVHLPLLQAPGSTSSTYAGPPASFD